MTNLSAKRYFGLMGILLLLCSINLGSATEQIRPGYKPQWTGCVTVGSWMVPDGGKISNRDIIARAVKSDVVLLGETHINREHHRWQLQTLAALYALRPNMVIGFEMFPRRVQAVLDQWVAGKLDEQEFLRAAQWNIVWSTDADLYLPLFHFARMNQIPMRALNIETSLRRQVTEKGFYSVPVEEREGVSRPALPSKDYVNFLLPIYKQHERKDKKEGEIDHDDPDFSRFIAGQQLWDRAMAQIIHAAHDVPNGTEKPLVVGVMGTGHILHGYGVPHQLHDLGIDNITSLLPWDTSRSCQTFVPGYADAVFGVMPYVSPATQSMRQRLGIRFEIAHGGAHVLQVEKDSIAETAGLLAADVILEIAGLGIKDTSDVINVVTRHAPGTWLPLKVKRNDETIEIIAKFPPL
ncbi:MAG: ChaN family lipoprotein [Nitrosomonas sp.]|nr:ChaN family lipoprotein [Nitrosomonas sp.]MDP1949486.1 ChaN family lipoprotein [Nitrosomonas sp.]